MGELAFAISDSNGIVTNSPFLSKGIELTATILFGYFNAIGVFTGQFGFAITSGLSMGTTVLITTTKALIAIFGRYEIFNFKLSIDFKFTIPISNE